MSTTLDEMNPPAVPEPVRYLDADGNANVALLQDRMPAALRTSSTTVLLTLALGILFLIVSYTPLWHTDLWGHLSYGRWMAAQGTVPSTEPLLPLARGVPFIDTAWLSQLAGYAMMERFGISGIQFLYAASIVLAAGVLAFTVARRTGNAAAALLSIGVFYWVAHQQLLVVRPQLAGLVCFVMVFVLATSVQLRRWQMAVIPLLFAVWANVHGSFLVGLVTLSLLTLGRGLDVWRRTGRWQAMFVESGTRRLFVVTELSALAVLLNPYGFAVYAEAFQVSASKNLQSLVEWDPLTLRMKQGRAAACVAVALMCAYRLTPRRVSFREVLVLLTLGGLAMWYCRMILWWAPVAAYSLSLHVAALWQAWRKQPRVEPVRTGLRTIITAGLVWIFFAYTPFGFTLLHGQPREAKAAATKLRRSVSTQTPVLLTEFLREHPPQGQVFNTYEWGDYLQWAGPEGMQVFVNSHAHLIPEEVWTDYLEIASGVGGWEDRLERYGVNAIIVDTESRAGLIRELEKLPDWEKKYKDNVGAVFYRKKPI